MSTFVEKNMPQDTNSKQVPILVGIVGVLAVGLLAFLVWMPARSQAAELETTMSSAQSDLSALSQTLQRYRQDSSSFESLLRAADTADSYIPYIPANSKEEAVFDLSIDIPILVDQAASASGFEIVQGTPALTPIPNVPETVGAMRVEISGTGTLEQFDTFIDELNAGGQLATVEDFSMTGNSAVAEGEAASTDIVPVDVNGVNSLRVNVLFWFTIRPTVTSDQAPAPTENPDTTETTAPTGPLPPLQPVGG